MAQARRGSRVTFKVAYGSSEFISGVVKKKKTNSLGVTWYVIRADNGNEFEVPEDMIYMAS